MPKISNDFKISNALSQIFDWVLNTPLVFLFIYVFYSSIANLPCRSSLFIGYIGSIDGSLYKKLAFVS